MTSCYPPMKILSGTNNKRRLEDSREMQNTFLDQLTHYLSKWISNHCTYRFIVLFFTIVQITMAFKWRRCGRQ